MFTGREHLMNEPRDRYGRYEGKLWIDDVAAGAPVLRVASHESASPHWPLWATLAFIIVFNSLAWALIVLLVMAAL